MRLIDADKLKLILNKKIDAALKQIENCLGEIECHRFEAAIMAFKECILSVNAQPTIDAVSVVRCKDCVYYEMLNENEHYCDAIYRDLSGDDEGVDFEPPQDHFCAYGKRRKANEH